MPLDFIDPVMTSGLLKTTNNLSELSATLPSMYVNTGLDQAIPVGTIFPWCSASEIAPSNWLFCWGQAVSRSGYSALFAVIGELYGGGNGTTTFNLPDLRGRVIGGVDTVSAPLGELTGDYFDGDTTVVGTAAGVQSSMADTTSMRSAATGMLINVVSNPEFSLVQPTMLLQYMIRTDVAAVAAP
jgi:microcystin-dependent protein